MAKPKKLVKIECATSFSLNVYITNAPIFTEDVLDVEGVSGVFLEHAQDNLLYLRVDPRYDIQEVSDEIEALLLSLIKVPDVFKQ